MDITPPQLMDCITVIIARAFVHLVMLTLVNLCVRVCACVLFKHDCERSFLPEVSLRGVPAHVK